MERKGKVKKFSLKKIRTVNQLLDDSDCRILIEELISRQSEVKGLVITILHKDGTIQSLMSGMSLLQATGALAASQAQLLNNDFEHFGPPEEGEQV